MKPIFTIHGGEYLFANEFKRRFPSLKLWLPVDDEGIDFLITDDKNTRPLGMQIKYSRDYNPLQVNNNIRTNLKTLGWFHLNRSKLQNSKANYWVLINYEGFTKTMDFFFIKPKVLLNIYNKLGRKGKIIDSYLWVMNNINKSYETRGLSKAAQSLILTGQNNNKYRDFTTFLDKWDIIKKHFKL
jgi:hypothetical protein